MMLPEILFFSGFPVVLLLLPSTLVIFTFLINKKYKNNDKKGYTLQ